MHIERVTLRNRSCDRCWSRSNNMSCNRLFVIAFLLTRNVAASAGLSKKRPQSRHFRYVSRPNRILRNCGHFSAMIHFSQPVPSDWNYFVVIVSLFHPLNRDYCLLLAGFRNGIGGFIDQSSMIVRTRRDKKRETVPVNSLVATSRRPTHLVLLNKIMSK